jgi:hypothetical protein
MRDLEDMLKNTDFSDESDKAAMKSRLLTKFSETQNNKQGEIYMKKRVFRPAVIAAAIVITTFALTAAVNAGSIMNIIHTFTIGDHAEYSVVEYPDGVLEELQTRRSEIPAEIQGQLFDKEGSVLTEYPEDGKLYNADGIPVVVRDSSDGGYTIKSVEENENEMYTRFDTIAEAEPYLAFDPLMPDTLPEGFALNSIAVFNGEDGKPVSENKYLEMFFSNAGESQEIYVQLRLMDEETRFDNAVSPEARKISINGSIGIIDGKMLNVEIDGVMYMISALNCESVSQDDMIAMAESLK